MPHVQARLDNAVFKEVKKDAIDKDKTLGDYVKDAVVEHLERSKSGSVVKETVNEPNQSTNEGD